jgi:hypothetical protein
MNFRPLALALFVPLLLLPPPATADEPEGSDVLISLAFLDHDIRRAIQFIAESGRLNVIVSPEVRGSLTVTLHDVPAREALRQVAAALGFTVAEQDYGILRVGPAERASPRPAADPPFVGVARSPLVPMHPWGGGRSPAGSSPQAAGSAGAPCAPGSADGSTRRVRTVAVGRRPFRTRPPPRARHPARRDPQPPPGDRGAEAPPHGLPLRPQRPLTATPHARRPP